ncbi:hypothetical protein JVT61DRAFT_4701 [Boletus reticuloceps]|uniref:DUF6533 domain-containing protein n=1 Tax=Boletus reticuloceps TaxID=495285 RepID=A0A8I3A901_9AGAM|nr:hypothetical protein JVT61DRAFT_4701 [Boletus reticuloceps]
MTSNAADRVAIPPAYAAAIRDVGYHSFASLTFLVWDSFVTLDDEVQYIWIMRNKSPFKWGYFFLRYGVILAHITHNILVESLANGSNPPILCRLWIAYIIAFTQSIQTTLELVLASRVFALYNRSKRIAFVLLILILTEVGGSVRSLWVGHDSGFYGTCLLVSPDKSAMDQSILGFIVHCTLIGLTLFKYYFALRAGWGRTPLVSLVVRDNTTVYTTIIFLLASVIVLCGLEDERGVIVFYWATGLTSISAARMILSMERFAREELSVGSPVGRALFTTQFSLEMITSNLDRGHDRSVP